MGRLLLRVPVLLLSICMVATAKDIYVAQEPAGVADGSNCANAYAYRFFNAAANWGSGESQIGPGTTVRLCGTVTTFNGSTYDYLQFHGSGTPGNPITLKWEDNAVLSVPSCGTRHCITMRGSYQTIDGGTNGILQATDSGTALGHHDAGSGIVGTPCNHCEIKNLAIQNLYIHTGTPVNLTSITGDGTTATATCAKACAFGIGDQVGIAKNSVFTPAPSVKVASTPTSTTFTFASTTTGKGTGGIAWDNYGGGNGVIVSGAGVSIHHNTCHDVLWCFQHVARDGDSTEIYRNTAWNTDHAVAVGNNTRARSAMVSISIHDNTIFDSANWDTYSNIFHHDGIHLFLLGEMTVSQPVLIYNNYIHGNWGANSTAQIFMQGSIPSIYIFNNLLVDENGQGTYKIRSASPGTSYYVFNNLFFRGVPPGNSYSQVYFTSCASMLFANNTTIRAADSGFWMGGGTGPWAFAGNGVQGNVYYLVQGHGNNGAWRSAPLRSLWTPRFSAYVSALKRYFPSAGGEFKSTLKDPRLASDYRLGAGSSAIAIGANLTWLGIPAANRDRDGNPRSASGAWDAGPYSYASSAQRAVQKAGENH